VPAVAQTILLLVLSNVFMTFAWYYHLKPEWQARPLYVVIVLSWGIALFEYILQVPANPSATRPTWSCRSSRSCRR